MKTAMIAAFAVALAAALAGCSKGDKAQGTPKPGSAKPPAGAGAAAQAADQPKGVAQTVCPVMGGKIDKAFYADHAGKRVCFCCGGCKEDFEKDPEKYIRQLESQGVKLEASPKEY